MSKLWLWLVNQKYASTTPQVWWSQGQCRERGEGDAQTVFVLWEHSPLLPVQWKGESVKMVVWRAPAKVCIQESEGAFQARIFYKCVPLKEKFHYSFPRPYDVFCPMCKGRLALWPKSANKFSCSQCPPNSRGMIENTGTNRLNCFLCDFDSCTDCSRILKTED